jgi:hypothetical protein
MENKFGESERLNILEWSILESSLFFFSSHIWSKENDALSSMM